ncbi:MAG: hypothetical protein ACYTEX_07855 [Planctomycetota bacterium]
MRNTKHAIAILALFCTGFVLVCLASADDVVSGRELLRAMRQRDRPNASVPAADRAAQTRVSTSSKQGQRVLHFPKDRSLGIVSVLTGTPEKRPMMPVFGGRDSWQYIGQAQGDVVVPADKPVQLRILRANQDLSPLAKLRADDLYMLAITIGTEPAYNADETIMPHLSNLTGLQVLHLARTNVTHKGMYYLKGLKSLEYLCIIEPQLDDSAVGALSELPSLEGLYLINGRMTDQGLEHLAKLPSLKELVVDGPRVRGPGLAHLAKSPCLEHLWLCNKTFGDSQIKYMRGILATWNSWTFFRLRLPRRGCRTCQILPNCSISGASVLTTRTSSI